MKKVMGIQSFNFKELEIEINKEISFLETQMGRDGKVIDIKFSVSDDEPCYYAMIVYDDGK